MKSRGDEIAVVYARAAVDDATAAGHARLLLLVLPLVGALMLASAWVLSDDPDPQTFDLSFVVGCGLLLLLVAGLFRARLVSYGFASTSGVALTGALLVERILVMFLQDDFDPQQQTLFVPVFAGLPLLYVMTFVLLPPQWAERVAVSLWLLISMLITALTMPHWPQPEQQAPVVMLLSFVWLGHSTYLVLFSAAWRRQQMLVDRHAKLAAAERGLHENVRQSEARFRSLFDLAAVGINVTDASGRYLMVNERMADMLGYSRDELVGMNFRDVSPPEDGAITARLMDSLTDGTTERFRQEKAYLRKDGGRIDVEVFTRELDDGAGQERRFICVALDISERKRADVLAAEHRQIRDFHFENTPLAVVEWDIEMRVRRWSKRAEQIFGWTEAEALGRTGEELRMFPVEEREPPRHRISRLFGGEVDRYTLKMALLRRGGRSLWAEVHNAIVRGPDGSIQGLVSMALDITESEEMLRMLNESEARFRSIFNQAAVGIALLDADGRWLNVNQKLCEITGYSLDELMQINFQSITHPDDLERDLHMSTAVMDRTIDHYSMEKRYVRKDGSLVWVLLFVRRLDATADLPARFVSVVEDIDERKAAEARVRALTASLESRVAERTEQLRDIIRAGQRRNEELTLITDMGRLLAAATDMSEAATVVTRYLPRIFPLADGALYLADPANERFERKAHWGEAKPGASTFERGECWGMRRGETHHVEGEPDALHCAHVHGDSRTHPHLCVPIQSLGAPLGLIELAWGRTSEGWAPEIPLIKTVAEKIGLAFGNLRLREELSRQALLDPLTGLNNRRWLEAALRMRVARHSRSGEGFAVLMIDVDHFKTVNDVYGHEAGDRALQEIGAALLRCVREGEAAARFGGEEFTVVLDTSLKQDAQGAAERMRLAVAAIRVRLKDRDLPPLTVSIGVAMYPNDGDDAQRVVERADEALYAAKRNGRNQVRMAGGDAATTPGQGANPPSPVTH